MSCLSRSIKNKANARFNVSVAELGGLDKWQTAVLEFVAISNRYIDGILQDILAMSASYPEIPITNSRLKFI